MWNIQIIPPIIVQNISIGGIFMKTCKADGCNRTDIKGKGYCGKHYAQIQKHGKILAKTRFDKNEIVIYDDYAEIILYDKKGNEKARALIDIEDVDKVKNIRWGFSQIK